MGNGVGDGTIVNGEVLLSALRRLEQRCRDNAAGLPQDDTPPEIWAGVLYCIGRVALLSPLVDIAEVLEPPQEMTRVPAARPWVCGIANNRGTLLPIFDLHAFLFGVSTARNPRNRVLVVRQEDFPFGLLVSEVVGIRHYETGAYDPQAPELGAGVDELLEGSFSRGEECYPVFSLLRLALHARFKLAAA